MSWMTGVIDALGNRSAQIYNVAGQKIADEDALGFRTSYAFDTGGRMVEVQNARGYRTTSILDAKKPEIGTLEGLETSNKM